MRARLFAALALAAPLSCAQRGGARLALPASWDDRRLEAVLAGGHGKPVLAVLRFEAGSLPAAGDLRIGDMVTTALSRSRRVDLVEREKIERVLDEQRFRLTGAVDDASKAAEVGKLLGAEAVVFGAVTNATQQTTDRFAYDLVRTEVRIDARVVDTTTGQILRSESGQGVSEAKVIRSAAGTLISGLKDPREEYRNAAASAVDAVAARMARTFSVAGVIVSTAAGRLIADLGADHGIAPGDELIALRPGEPLFHPVTRQPIGRDKQLLDALTVSAVEQQTAVLRRRGLNDVPLRAGDIVVLSREAEDR